MKQENVINQIIEGLQEEEFTLQKQLAFINGQLQYNKKIQGSVKQFQQAMESETLKTRGRGNKKGKTNG